jgi:hypothetical protein
VTLLALLLVAAEPFRRQSRRHRRKSFKIEVIFFWRKFCVRLRVRARGRTPQAWVSASRQADRGVHDEQARRGQACPRPYPVLGASQAQQRRSSSFIVSLPAEEPVRLAHAVALAADGCLPALDADLPERRDHVIGGLIGDLDQRKAIGDLDRADVPG